MMLEKRHLILTAALVVTLWLTWHGIQKDKEMEISQPTRVLNTSQRDTKVFEAIDNKKLQLKIRNIPSSTENLFSTQHQAITPTIRTTTFKASESVAPIAPPLPFKYLGRMFAGSGSGVMLNVQGEVTPIQIGDVLLGQYKVQSIQDSAGALQIQFLYLPLKQIQTLSAPTGN